MTTRIVLLPGLDGTGQLFRPLLAVMPPGASARVVAYPTTGPQSYESLLPFLTEQLRGERDVFLVAESFSGPLALRYTGIHGERVRALVLCATFVVPPAPGWLRYIVMPLWFRLPPPAAAVRRFMVGPGASDELVRAVTAAVRSVPPAVVAARLRAVLGVNCADDLRRCCAPVLFLAAGNDALLRPSGLRAVQIALPDVTVRTVDGPHLLLQAKPQAAWREIAQFLGEHGVTVR